MLNKKVIFVYHTILKLDFITQIIYCIIHICLCSNFILFLFSTLVSVSNKWNVETILTFPYSYNWQKFEQPQNKWKKNLGVSEYGPWICNWANHSLYSWTSFEMILLFDFCTASKILICFGLIKRFPDNYKTYSTHLGSINKKRLSHLADFGC